VVLNSRARAKVAGVALLAGLPLLGGCAGVGSFFNPAFLQVLGVGEQAASLPGEAPAVVLAVENATQHVIEFRVTWRDLEGRIQERTRALAVGEEYSEALICPVQEMTLGDVSNLDDIGAIVRLGGGTANDPFVEVEPFGVLLQDGINYDCGDSVTFVIQPSSVTLSGYRVLAQIRRSGAQAQTGTP
jgi:hypothetical protein